MGGMREALSLRSQVSDPGPLQAWLGLPAFSKGGWPTSRTWHLGQAPSKGASSGGHSPGDGCQVSWGVCWAPVRGGSSLSGGVPDLRSGGLPAPGPCPAQASRGRTRLVAVASGVGPAPSLPLDAPGEGAARWGVGCPWPGLRDRPSSGLSGAERDSLSALSLQLLLAGQILKETGWLEKIRPS